MWETDRQTDTQTHRQRDVVMDGLVGSFPLVFFSVSLLLIYRKATDFLCGVFLSLFNVFTSRSLLAKF